MNWHKVKQYLFNNLWHGEQERTHIYNPVRVVYSLMNPDFARVWGIDISHWDRNVNLSFTKGLGASFVFIKAIDGTIQNSYFVPNRQRAVDASLLHAPYGWLYRDVNVSCVAQAQAYSNIVKQYPSDLPPVIDFEWTRYAGASSNPTYADLDKWVTEWLRLGNRKPILYSAAGYMNPLGQIPSALKQKFAGIWIANYGVNNPAMPAGYAANEWLVHQFSDSGDAVNIAPNDSGKLEVDLNYFNGTEAQLYALAGQSVPDGGSMNYFELRSNVAGEYRSIRAPHTSSHIQGAKIGQLNVGAVAKSIEKYQYTASVVISGATYAQVGDIWWRVYEANGAPIDGWIAEVHLGKRYLNVTEVGAPPPPPAPADNTIDVVLTDKDAAGTVTGVWKGTLTKQ